MKTRYALKIIKTVTITIKMTEALNSTENIKISCLSKLKYNKLLFYIFNLSIRVIKTVMRYIQTTKQIVF